MNETVSATIPLEVVCDVNGGSGWLSATFTYTTADQVAVSIAFCDCSSAERDEDRTWRIARDLLADGLHGPAGTGEVQVWPRMGWPERVAIVLESDDGRAEFSVSRQALDRFLIRSFNLVPRGSERVDVDGLLRQLLDTDEVR